MVKIRQEHDALSEAIEPVPFQNPDRPGLGIEVLSLEELRAKLPARHRRIRSRPDFHQLMLIESGATVHDIDFVRHTCRAGDALLLRPGQVQQFIRDAGATGWVVLFTSEFVPPEAALEHALGHGAVEAVGLPAAQRRVVGTTVSALAAAYRALRAGDGMAIQATRHLLLALLLQLAAAREGIQVQPAPAGVLRVYRRFLQALETGYLQSRQVASYAAAIGCSTRTLARACEALGGASPKALVERRVLLEAKRLLAHSALGVSQISATLGYSEPTNFVKAFRRAEGMTPLQFRQQLQH
ncbi:MAG: hypothetical protein RL404_2757 [Pseudomonadota bacterium]|jgi:AraC-like DNA-binding protein